MLHRSNWLPSRLLQLGSLLVAFFGFQPAFAFTLGGPDWTHQAEPMGEPYTVYENCNDTTDELAAIQAAAQTWNSAGADFILEYGGSSENSAPSNDGVHQIRWGTNVPPGYVAWTSYMFNYSGVCGNPPNCLHPECSCELTDVDCVFDSNLNWSTATPTPTSSFDIETVMLHEFGHYLVLGHSTPPAVMQPEIAIGEQKRSLTDDDVNGIYAIYGASDCTDVDGDGWCMQGDDCDDTDPSIHPEGSEGPAEDLTCSDGLDNDCDGSTDSEDRDCAAGPCTGTAEASVAHGSNPVNGASSLAGRLAYILLPLGAVIAIRIWRRRR